MCFSGLISWRLVVAEYYFSPLIFEGFENNSLKLLFPITNGKKKKIHLKQLQFLGQLMFLVCLSTIITQHTDRAAAVDRQGPALQKTIREKYLHQVFTT